MLQPSLRSSFCLKTITLSAACLLMVGLWNPVSSKIYTRCQLSKELIRFRFPRNLITMWVCVLDNESNRTTNKVIHHENVTSYGLFQLNSTQSCRKGRKGGLCSIKCEDLTNEELSDDVKCGKRVYDKLGFSAWPSYKTKCKRKPPEITCP